MRKYVDFLEAMKALSFGQNVSVWFDDGLVFDIKADDELADFFGVTFRELAYAKWTIEGCGC